MDYWQFFIHLSKQGKNLIRISKNCSMIFLGKLKSLTDLIYLFSAKSFHSFSVSREQDYMRARYWLVEMFPSMLSMQPI